MKKIALVAGVVALVVVPSTALSFFARSWNGNIKGEPTISFVGYDIHKTATGKRKVDNFIVDRLQFSCANGSSGRTSAWETDERFRVDHGQFSGRVQVTQAELDPVMKLTGELLGGGLAKGTVRLFGNINPDHPNNAQCDTGRLKWRASKSG
jgi:hypothetical protein